MYKIYFLNPYLLQGKGDLSKIQILVHFLLFSRIESTQILVNLCK